jgi:cyclophilin family peptidyl-prolyl cis-trans isomerase
MNNKVLIPIVIIIAVIGLYLLFQNDIQKDSQENEEVNPNQNTLLDDVTKMDIPIPTGAPVEFTKAVLKTSKGDITVEFFNEDSPKTVENFVNLSKAGFYDGTKFHRVIKDFMIQGGDPLSKDDSKEGVWGTGGPEYRFEDEINENKLVRGSLAMANSGPNTNGSQFFVVTVEATPWLDGRHTNFGTVIEGMDIVDAIENVETAPGDRPLEPILLDSIELIK